MKALISPLPQCSPVGAGLVVGMVEAAVEEVVDQYTPRVLLEVVQSTLQTTQVVELFTQPTAMEAKHTTTMEVRLLVSGVSVD